MHGSILSFAYKFAAAPHPGLELDTYTTPDLTSFHVQDSGFDHNVIIISQTMTAFHSQQMLPDDSLLFIIADTLSRCKSTVHFHERQ